MYSACHWALKCEKEKKKKKSKANPSGIVSSVCFVFDKQDFQLVFNIELRAFFFFFKQIMELKHF